MRRVLIVSWLALVGGLGWSGAALAQTENDFVTAFAGHWQTLDPRFSADSACRVTLLGERSDNHYKLEQSHCGGPLASVQGWAIVDNQLGLLGAENKVIARLGGNQSRMSGQTATGSTVIFERISDEAAASPAPAGAPQPQGCLYYGYTATCAAQADMTRPTAGGEGETAKAEVLVRLNARSEARPDASVVATIPAKTCVVVDECTTASDGNWCKARISDMTGWIHQRAVRRGRWPILAFTGHCS